MQLNMHAQFNAHKRVDVSVRYNENTTQEWTRCGYMQASGVLTLSGVGTVMKFTSRANVLKKRILNKLSLLQETIF